MRIPHLPPELIDQILGHLHGEKWTLESSSLVCKAWVHLSRSHLFAEVFLDDNLVKRLVAFSQRETVVIPYIRHLCLRQMMHPQLWDDAIPELVGFQRVRSFTLAEFSHYYLNAEARSLLFTQFTGIVRFCVIGYGHISGTYLADAICSFPRLEVLALGNICLVPIHIFGEDTASSPSSRTISRHLHTVEICDIDGIALLAWLLSFQNLPSLRFLYLRWLSVTFKTFNDLLSNFRFLERLLFSVHHIVKSHHEFIDLSHHENLRSLYIEHLMSLDPTKCVVQTLASITSTVMDEITFDILALDDQAGYAGIEWRLVDAILQSPQFSKLRAIYINVISPEPRLFSSSWTQSMIQQLLASFPIRLSQCHARGILSIRSMDGTVGREFYSF